MFAKVAVEVPSSNTDELFTYHVNDDLKDLVHVGSRVYVEFGFRKLMGYVMEISDDTNFNHQTKEILEVIDFEQGLTIEQIELSKKIANETKSFLISALDLMYPSFMKSKVRKYINVLNYDKVDAELAMNLGHKSKVLITNEILKYYKKIKREIDKGNIEIVNDLFTYGKKKTIKYYRLKNHDLNIKSLKRKEIIAFLENNKSDATYEEILETISCSEILLKKMVEDNILELLEKTPKFENREEKTTYKPNFNFEENLLIEKFRTLSKKPFLLISADELFKLKTYLKLAYDEINANRQVLIVTPTILSNTIIYKYFKENLKGYRIFQFSSRITNNEYYYNYNNVKEQNVDIVITTKQSIFLPLENIGLIIMVDEENMFYLNEQNPKYSVHEVLKFRTEHHQAKLLLTSSAPSVESFFHYTNAKYFLLEKPPVLSKNITLVNLRDSLDDLMLSETLKAKLTENLRLNQVSLLVLNSLGYSPLIMCNECSRIIKCPKCKINLSYHKDKNVYKCSYCNEQFESITCEHCETSDFTMLGIGLEKLKERLNELYPNSKIHQVDSTTMTQKNAYDDLLVMLEEKEIDFVIGTLPVLSVLNPSIKLVAFINADSILNASDYRSSEICYQAISKVNQDTYEVVIQGYNIEHYAIQLALNKNYREFFDKELKIRNDYSYPPFIQISRLQVIGDYKDIYYYANYFKKVFKRLINGDVLGPVYQSKIRGIQLIIKYTEFEKLSKLIDEVNNKFKDNKLIVNFERYPVTFS